MALDTETLTLLLDAVRRFVHERLIPAEDELAASGQVPPDIVTEMRELACSACRSRPTMAAWA